MEDAAVCQLHSYRLQLVPLTLSQDLAHIGFVHDAAALLLYAICRPGACFQASVSAVQLPLQQLCLHESSAFSAGARQFCSLAPLREVAAGTNQHIVR